ncbi:MAG: hypothetical protein PHG40_00585 [Candidatus Omnitrophica bacterium]|nr:hypothetical protein [Candidatus Omnitrophota bacterium]
MLGRLGKKAQSTAEYAIIIALVIAAVVAMQVYVRRGIQGRVRDVVDHTGAGGDVGGENLSFSSGQYEPYYNQTTGSTSQKSQNTESVDGTSRSSTTSVDATREQTTGWFGSEE